MSVKYVVLQPIGSGRELGLHGQVISTHRTIVGAFEAIARANRRLSRMPGQQSSWYDWHVRALDAGKLRYLTAAEKGEESWS